MQQLKYFLDLPEDPYPIVEEELSYPEFWKDCPPGEKFEYHNYNFVILGIIIEELTGMTLEEYYQENIFTPLGMFNTSFYVSNFDINQLAVPYVHFPVRLPGFYIPLPQYELGYFKAAGGIRSTVNDLSHFLIAHMNGGVYNDVRILNESSIDMMHNVTDSDGSYGLGWTSVNLGFITIEGHPGNTYGFISGMGFNRSKNIGILLFYNEWYPPLFSMLGSPIIEQLVQISILQALLEKTEEL